MFLSNKTILVTGAVGFVGSNLVLGLLRTSEGGKSVGLDNMNSYSGDATAKGTKRRGWVAETAL